MAPKKTLRPAQGSGRTIGVVSGYVFKLLRESAGLTQSNFAEHVGVDITTAQGWETGRRPLTALKTGELVRMRNTLMSLGVDAECIPLLSDAIEADIVISDAVEFGGVARDADTHPLGSYVHRRDLVNLIMWPFTGIPSDPVARISPAPRPRRGPVATGPYLTAECRERFFDHMRVTAGSRNGTRHSLLSRQAVYLLGFDKRADSMRWIAQDRRDLIQPPRRGDPSTWLAARSSAIARARGGDREALRSFIATALTSDDEREANLNYWAYWLGEVPELHSRDGFTADSAFSRWSGARLLEHLIDTLDKGHETVDLNIHSLWSLLIARPTLLSHNRRLHERARLKIDAAHTSQDLDRQAQRELGNVAYALRLATR